jgi:rhodanese-related sulfurtransferase
VLRRLFSGDSSIPSINPKEAWERLSDKQAKAVLVDVREPWEFNSGHAKGARNIPLSQFARRVKEIPQGRDVLVICQSGHRSMSAARMLQQQGATQVFNISGGTTIWRMHGLPMDSGGR